MQILSLTYEYPPVGGGGAIVASALNQALVASGEVVEVVTSRMKGLAREETVGGVRIHRAACVRCHRHYTTAAELATTLLPAYRAAARVAMSLRPDLIHSHFALPSGLVAWWLWQRLGVPYVLTTHGSDIPGYNPDRFIALHALLKPLWRRIVRDAAAVTSASHYLANLLRRHIDVPVHIVPNGYSPETSIGREKRRMVLVVARMFPRKGVQHFLDSVADLRTDWEFVIAGDGPYLPAIRERARRVRAPIRFTGFVDRATLRGLYEEARILVFPSIRENFPMVLLEAMDAGCAVITTDAEGCAEVVGEAGVVIKAGDAPQLHDALVRLMADPVACAELSLRAQLRANLFRWPRIAGLYKEVFERARRRAPLPAIDVQRANTP